MNSEIINWQEFFKIKLLSVEEMMG